MINASSLLTNLTNSSVASVVGEHGDAANGHNGIGPSDVILDIYEFELGAFEWSLALVSSLIFFVGIVGNLLVILVVLKNSHMRTITNIFILNLAIGDFLVILICLPYTMINDITGNWWFGNLMCKLMIQVQYISVVASVMTLTSISYERYYAIVYPFKFKATKFRAKMILLLVWIMAICISSPLAIVMTVSPFQVEDTDIGKNYLIFSCHPTWDPIFQNVYDLVNFSILYILPMILIFYTYSKVFKVLWRIDKRFAQDEHESTTTTAPAVNNNNNNNNNSSTSGDTDAVGSARNSIQQTGTGTKLPLTPINTPQLMAKHSAFKISKSKQKTAIAAPTTNNDAYSSVIKANSLALSGTGSSKHALRASNAVNVSCSISSSSGHTATNAASSKMKAQLVARRKAAKMLISVAILFGICYLPIQVLNIIRYMRPSLMESISARYIKAIFGISHCLIYVNSSVNPLIYNFMSDNFHKEFRTILLCKRNERASNKYGAVATSENTREHTTQFKQYNSQHSQHHQQQQQQQQLLLQQQQQQLHNHSQYNHSNNYTTSSSNSTSNHQHQKQQQAHCKTNGNHHKMGHSNNRVENIELSSTEANVMASIIHSNSINNINKINNSIIIIDNDNTNNNNIKHECNNNIDSITVTRTRSLNIAADVDDSDSRSLL